LNCGGWGGAGAGAGWGGGSGDARDGWAEGDRRRLDDR
jgi:hypothetical protein